MNIIDYSVGHICFIAFDGVVQATKSDTTIRTSSRSAFSMEHTARAVFVV